MHLSDKRCTCCVWEVVPPLGPRAMNFQLSRAAKLSPPAAPLNRPSHGIP